MPADVARGAGRGRARAPLGFDGGRGASVVIDGGRGTLSVASPPLPRDTIGCAVSASPGPREVVGRANSASPAARELVGRCRETPDCSENFYAVPLLLLFPLFNVASVLIYGPYVFARVGEQLARPKPKHG